MPNYVSNRIRVYGDRRAEVVDALRADPENPDREDEELDFAKLIPEPEYSGDNSIKTDENGNIKHPDWYEWRCTNWGTKWNCGSSEINEYDEFTELFFLTAWNPPEPLLLKLGEIAQEKDCSLEGWFADECDGEICGWIDDGEIMYAPNEEKYRKECRNMAIYNEENHEEDNEYSD